MKYIYMNRESIILFIIFKEEKILLSWILIIDLHLNWYFAINQKRWISMNLGFKWLIRNFDSITWEKS